MELSRLDQREPAEIYRQIWAICGATCVLTTTVVGCHWVLSTGRQWVTDMPIVEQTHTLSNLENFYESRMWNTRTDVRLFIPCQWNEYGCQHHTYNRIVSWNHRVCSQCIPHLLTDTQGALYISISGTLPLVPCWRWCISAADCHRQWDVVSPFRIHRKTSTLAGEAPHFVLTEEIQSHKHLPLKWCWQHCVTFRNLCFWTANYITLIADVTIKCFRSCIWKWRTSMWLNTLTALSCWRSVPVSIWPPDFSTNCLT